jgi:Domain of unknown function (DUF1510)
MAKYNSRLDRHSKNKTNTVLNIAIAVVVLLIVVVGATILTGNGSDKDKASTSVENSGENTTENKADKDNKENKSEQKNDDDSVSMNGESTESEDEQKEKDKNKEEENEDSPEEKKSVALNDSSAQVEEGTEPNVEKTIVHPDWEPVGTEQSGEHVSSYDPGSQDWQEKVKALSYATGIPENNMTVWYIEGNGGPQKSIGTVTEKGGSTAYRVYLQWTDGQGWQPTKVEELKENDKD